MSKKNKGLPLDIHFVNKKPISSFCLEPEGGFIGQSCKDYYLFFFILKQADIHFVNEGLVEKFIQYLFWYSRSEWISNPFFAAFSLNFLSEKAAKKTELPCYTRDVDLIHFVNKVNKQEVSNDTNVNKVNIRSVYKHWF